MARAVLHRPGKPGPDTVVPAHGVELTGWTLDAAGLTAYRTVVGSTAALPLLFPAVVGTRLHRDLMGLGRLPVRGTGLVHVASQVWVDGRLPLTGAWDVAAWADGTRHTRSGLELDLWARCQSGDAAWTARVVVLARSRTASGEMDSAVPDLPTEGTWQTDQGLDVPVDTGWAYARVSGDYNPIHLNVLSAKPFGFDRAIAHGWWSLARSLAVLELDETPVEPRRLEVAYRRPVLLPSTPRLVSRGEDGATTLALLRRDGSPHLVARLT